MVKNESDWLINLLARMLLSMKSMAYLSMHLCLLNGNNVVKSKACNGKNQNTRLRNDVVK